jgi:hypothetical protein
MLNSMPSVERRHLFQIDRPGSKLDMPAAQELLEPLGVSLDLRYGPVSVNPRLGRYVVRGTASADALERVRALDGVTVFSDAPIAPTSLTR